VSKAPTTKFIATPKTDPVQKLRRGDKCLENNPAFPAAIARKPPARKTASINSGSKYGAQPDKPHAICQAMS